ncbi:MAG: hypothetical protein GF331_08470 [Chitinivibrionales bacterium]|nr:hypothetical protein [Chitinivibrionales bacterium]
MRPRFPHARTCIAAGFAVVVVLTVCNSRRDARTPQALPDEALPFKPVSAAASKARSGSAPIARGKPYDQRLREQLDEQKDLAKAYELFREQLPDARKKGQLQVLFEVFVNCNAFSSGEELAKIHRPVLQAWVRDALAEEDEATRMLYSQYCSYFRVDDSYYRQFYVDKRQMRPGEEVRVYKYYYDRGRKEMLTPYTIEIARLTLDSLLKPSGFTKVSSETVKGVDYDHQYRHTIAEPGVYRVTISGEEHFQQLYIQVSWLDCVVKADPEKLIVFGSSYKDTVPPPYTVNFVSPEGDIHKTKTDTNGLCALRHHYADAKQAASVKVVLEKKGQLAFMEGYFPTATRDTSIEYHLYSDRPVYRPGHKVHFRGMLKLLVDSREIGVAQADSVDIAITNPEGTQVYRDTLPVDRWGHFGDSLDLVDNARQGRYYFAYNGVRNADSKTRTYSTRGYRYRSFLVDAYKKPEFVIKVKAERETYFPGEEAEITVQGEYYFGGPLSNVPVTVRWHRQSMHHYFASWGRARAVFYPHGGREFLKQEELKLDKDGTLTLRYTGKPQSDYEYIVAEVIATDQSRRQVREEARIRIAKHDAYLSIMLDKYEYEVGEEVDIEIVAVDLEGEALEGSVGVRIKKDREIIGDRTVAIPSSGRVHTKLKPQERGTYRIEASAKGARGKTVYVEREFTVVKERRWDWSWERIEITADKEQYGIGDTARLTVKAGADDTRALCTVEGQKLRAYDVRVLREHALEYRIPLTRELGPNVGFNVVFSGQSRQAHQYLQIRVVDSSALLDVSLEGKRTLKPGGLFKGSLKVRDQDGKPVQASMSVALVDEAIFDVAKTLEKTVSNRYYYWYPQGATEGVLGLFPSYYSNRVVTRYNEFSPKYLLALDGIAEARQEVMTDAAEAEMLKSAAPAAPSQAPRRSRAAPKAKKEAAVAGMAADEADKEQQGEPPRERKDFKDLGYWDPSLTTDANGAAELSFTMPDDLTKWRLVLVGSDGGRYLLEFRDSLITRQDIMVKLQAPRGFVTDDSAVVSSVIHNYAEKQVQAEVAFEVKAGTGRVKLAGPAKRNATIAKNGTVRMDWPVHVLQAGSVTFYTEVRSKLGGDAESRTYPILYHGIQQVVSDAGVLTENESRASAALPSPEDAAPGSRTLTIEYAPTLAYSLFESLDYLTGYPYGCVEQTMSRFLPNLYVAAVLKKLDMRNDSLLKMIPKYTHKGIERLKRFQHGDGGWGWWENDKSDPRMTALVVHGLSYAVDTDIDVEDKATARAMLDRGCRAALRLMQSGEIQQRINLAHALLRTQYVNKTEPTVMAAYKQRGKLSAYGLALLLECLHVLEKKKETNDVAELLVSMANESAGMAWWGGSKRYHWYNQDEETTARVLRAFSTVRAEDDLVRKAVLWLCRHKRKGYWVSTKTTAVVIEALSHYLARSGEFDPNFTAEIELNGKTLARERITKSTMKQAHGRIVLPDSLIGDRNDLTFSMKGTGRLYYSVVLRYATTEKPIQARSNGIAVSRTYTRIVYTQDQDGEWKVERKPFEGTLRSGDELEVAVKIESDASYEHMLLEDFFPSGMEVLRKSQDWYDRWCRWWWWGYTHREARDDRMVFFLDYVSPGERTFTYLLRAETPGRFVGLPARAELMYDPSVTGNSEETIVTIADAH